MGWVMGFATLGRTWSQSATRPWAGMSNCGRQDTSDLASAAVGAGPKVCHRARPHRETSREAHRPARPQHSPTGASPGCTGPSDQVLRLPPPNPSRMCSPRLTALKQRKWSPRSDSNRRPSDYESESLRPAGAIQAGSGCSRQRGRLLSVLLTCRVMAGGMTKRMTGLSRGSSTEPWRPSDQRSEGRSSHREGRPPPLPHQIRHLPTDNRMAGQADSTLPLGSLRREVF
jgi:hypothetical protein